MAFEFDEHTSVTPAGTGAYDATLHPGWLVGGAINGGLLLAVIGQAIRQTVPAKPDPLAISAHFLSAATPGPATVSTRVLREGGSVATVAADLSQGGDVRLTTLATFGDLGALTGDPRTTHPQPDLPPVEECVAGSLAPPEVRTMAPLMERFDLRFDPRTVGWAVGRPSGNGMIQAWFRLADGREPDPISLLTVVDGLPPVTFDLGLFGWAPTLELSVHVRARPAPGWLRVRHETRNVAGGMFEEDCDVWDSADRLVAQSRQLARLPRPA